MSACDVTIIYGFYTRHYYYYLYISICLFILISLPPSFFVEKKTAPVRLNLSIYFNLSPSFLFYCKRKLPRQEINSQNYPLIRFSAIKMSFFFALFYFSWHNCQTCLQIFILSVHICSNSKHFYRFLCFFFLSLKSMKSSACTQFLRLKRRQ